MADILKFKNKEYIDKKILYLFKKIDKYIKGHDDVKENYDYLTNYFYNVYEKVKNGKWNDPSNLIFLNKLYEVTHEREKEDIYINQLEYIRMYDMLKKDLIKLDAEYIRMFLNIYYEFGDVDVNVYKTLIESFSNKMIKDSIESEKEFSKKADKILDYAECIIDGINPVDYAVSLKNEKQVKENKKEEFEDLENGILTIDRIHKYYLNQAMSLKEFTCDFPTNDIMSNITKIMRIKRYSNNVQIKFITIMQSYHKCNIGLIEKIKFMSHLVEIFLYYNEKIEKMDIDILESLLFYKKMNELTMEDVSDFYERNERRL